MTLGSHTITRLRGVVGTDDYHNEVTDWTTPDSLDIPGCSFQPGGGSEIHDGRDVSTFDASVWAPSGSDVLTIDRVVYAGQTYEVTSVEPWDFPPLSHLVIRLQKVSG